MMSSPKAERTVELTKAPMSDMDGNDKDLRKAEDLVCELCADFYAKGWCSGTGGGICIRVGFVSRHLT